MKKEYKMVRLREPTYKKLKKFKKDLTLSEKIEKLLSNYEE